MTLASGAAINANGGPGVSLLQGPSSYFGGGAGGGILLEGPRVTLGNGTELLVNGGPAAAAGDFSPPTSETTAASIGGRCVSNGMYRCGNGGNGAGADAPASSGEDVAFFNTANYEFRSAGGGGGLGFIRINTPTGSYTKASDTIESGVVTAGTLKTR